MDPHGSESDPEASRIKLLLDRLAALLGRLPSDRREAFAEILNEGESKEDDAGDTVKEDVRGPAC